MPSNAYFLAKFCFDTAENEPAKNLQKFTKKMQNLIAKLAKLQRVDREGPLFGRRVLRRHGLRRVGRPAGRELVLARPRVHPELVAALAFRRGVLEPRGFHLCFPDSTYLFI